MLRRFNLGGLVKWRHTALVLLGIILVTGTGCTRRFFRNKTDKEVAHVLAEKDVVPAWKIEQFGVYPPPLARFADPTNPDRPPMPPDDPAAKEFSPNPQKPPHKAGIARVEGTGYLQLLAAWSAHNRFHAPADNTAAEEQDQIGLGEVLRADQVGVAKGPPEELPQPRTLDQAETGPTPTPLEQCAPYLITLEQSVELGLINSREYQTRREDLYLTALPVTRERFGFAFQFFAFGEAIREWTGQDRPEGYGDRWRLNNEAGFTKLFSTGALLLFSFANRTVIELSGRRDTTSVSTINLDLIQPLLRGGGKAVTLEPLTQVERDLLYEIRNYARFRKEFFHYITGGGELFSLGGGAGFGSAFTPGSVTLGSGNPARPEILPSSAGRVDLGGAPTAPSEGFLPTVQRVGNIKIQEDNLRRFEDILKLYQAYEEGGEVSALQVGQVQLSLLDVQAGLLQARRDHGDALDRFKQQLGLPPPVPLELDRSAIKIILDQYDRYERILKQFEEIAQQLERYEKTEEADQLRERVRLLLTESPLVRGATQFRGTIEERWRRWQRPQLDDDGLAELLLQQRARRRKLLDARTDLEQKGQTLSPEQERALRQSGAELALGELEASLRLYERGLWQKAPKVADQQEIHARLFRDIRNAITDVLAEASRERIDRLREQWPVLAAAPVAGVDLARSDLDKAMDVAVKWALDNRLDLMNARAEVVDAWRQIAVYANSLLGVFNVGYHVDSSTPPDQAKPLAFQAAQTRHQLFLNYELPLVRLIERNNYRAALIAYQRARRALQAAEDDVAAQVRSDVRQLQVLTRTYEIQKQSVELAYQQVESALETFRAPQQPGAGGSNAASAAALTNQLLGAYRGLPAAQQRLLGIWIDYLIARQQLYVDLELMPLDARGVWIDEHTTGTPSCLPVAELQRGDPTP